MELTISETEKKIFKNWKCCLYTASSLKIAVGSAIFILIMAEKDDYESQLAEQLWLYLITMSMFVVSGVVGFSAAKNIDRRLLFFHALSDVFLICDVAIFIIYMLGKFYNY